MYLDYWGFTIFPFENVPDADFFYPSAGHEEALTRLSYAAKMRKGGAMLSGEIGCGKTTLTRVYIEELSRERFDIGLIINPRLESTEFLQEILYQFGMVDAPDTKVKCLRMLNDKMIANMKENTETLLIVDEAQLLTESTFEEIRLLLNFQLNDRFLLSIILVGQPELKSKVRNIKQLEQRIAIKYHMTPFDFKDTARYIIFRQKKAGKNGNAFSRQAIERIYKHSGGVPRKINNLCDMKKRIKYLRIKYLYVFGQYRISLFLSPLLSILAFLMVQSCYSTTAIKGIPVKELIVARDQTVTRRMPTEEEKEEIARMSRVTSNKVFTVISGIPEYRIGPLDLLEITSHVGDKKTTTTATVNNRGRISHSFIDDLDVAGLTPSQLDDLLTKKMSTYIKKPRIDILVKEFKSKRALVMGELVSLRATYITKGESGRIYLQGKTTLMDFIALAGGYTERGDIRNTRIIRGGKTYTINLYDIIQRGDKTQNVIIDDGDIVEISELPDIDERIYVLGEVANQGIYALKNARDLLGAIALAGSITKLAVEENTLIVRGYESGKKPLVMMADLKAILRKGDLSQNIPLNNGDLVYVPRMKIGDINDWIENTIPLLDILLYPGRFRDTYFKEE